MSTHLARGLPLLVLLLAPVTVAALAWLATLAQQLGRSLPDCNEDMGWPDGPSRLSEHKPAICCDCGAAVEKS